MAYVPIFAMLWNQKSTFMVTLLEIIFHCACCCFCCKPVKNSYLISKHVFCQWLCSFRTPKKIFLGFHLGCFSITSCTFFLLDASWTIDLDIDGRLRSDLAKTLVYLCANLPKNEVHSCAMTICVFIEPWPLLKSEKKNTGEKQHLAYSTHQEKMDLTPK